MLDCFLRSLLSPFRAASSEVESGSSEMCCSMKATVLFLSSYHLWFATTQAVIIAPTVVSSISTNLTECLFAIIYFLVFFTSGLLIFRGADQERTMLIGSGALLLIFVLGKRYLIMYHGLLLKPTLPEGDFLNPYGTTVPVLFTILLYVFYLSILFCYHNELKYASPQSCLTPLASRRQQQFLPNSGSIHSAHSISMPMHSMANK